MFHILPYLWPYKNKITQPETQKDKANLRSDFFHDFLAIL